MIKINCVRNKYVKKNISSYGNNKFKRYFKKHKKLEAKNWSFKNNASNNISINIKNVFILRMEQMSIIEKNQKQKLIERASYSYTNRQNVDI